MNPVLASWSLPSKGLDQALAWTHISILDPAHRRLAWSACLCGLVIPMGLRDQRTIRTCTFLTRGITYVLYAREHCDVSQKNVIRPCKKKTLYDCTSVR